MLARRCRLSSKASHKGRVVGNGGVRALVGPCDGINIEIHALKPEGQLTPNSSRDSRR